MNMSTAPHNDAPLSALLQAAERAAAAGRQEEAARLLTEAQAIAPEHPQVMNALGMRAFAQGDAAGAREWLQRALTADAKTPLLWLNFALTCRALRDAKSELAALDQALALDPYFFLALLQKATLLERQGKPKQAAGVFQAFLACAPPPAQQPPALQAAVAHARKALQANSRALESHLKKQMENLQGLPASARFDECMDVLLGKKRVYTQQPTFMHFPRLPAIAFYERGDFPWLDAVEASAADIREELLAALRHDAQFVPYVTHPDGAPLNQWRELNHSRRWSALHLLREGRRIEENLARCPHTAAMLAEAPLADVRGHAPNAFFSLLAPRTRIPPHTGVTNTRLVVHLPLIVPPACGFRVGAETREWRPGEAWVFDDTIEHEAWNDSDEPRAILIFDIWNPFLTDTERDLVRAATAAIMDFYQEPSPAEPASMGRSGFSPTPPKMSG